MNLFLGNRGTKLYKLKDENIASKFINRGTNDENMWEHRAILEGSKGTRTPLGDPQNQCPLTRLIANFRVSIPHRCSTTVP